jgi:hypothetical protein
MRKAVAGVGIAKADARNGDWMEEEPVCTVLDHPHGDYCTSFTLAVNAVKIDTGMGLDDAVQFALKAVDDRYSVYSRDVRAAFEVRWS